MIDREKVINGLNCCSHTDGANCIYCPYDNSDTDCAALMSMDALALLKEREAEWIYGEDATGVDGWHCSECHFFEPWFYDYDDDIDFIKRYEHCPKCGRRMISYTGKQEG